MANETTTLEDVVLSRLDHAAVAVSDQLSTDAASQLAGRIADRLRDAAVPIAQQTWIVATSGDDNAAARIAAAVSDHAAGARLLVHDARALDDLTFERRVLGQRRGGIYLNAAWQSASVRIACGDAADLVQGLAAFFIPPELLRPDDLRADVLLES